MTADKAAVVVFWCSGYLPVRPDAPGDPCRRRVLPSSRLKAVWAVFEDVWQHIIPAELGGTSEQNRLGQELAGLLINPDDDGAPQSRLREEDILRLRTILHLYADAIVGNSGSSV